MVGIFSIVAMIGFGMSCFTLAFYMAEKKKRQEFDDKIEKLIKSANETVKMNIELNDKVNKHEFLLNKR